MSSRALRRLREDQKQQQQQPPVDVVREEDSTDSEDEESDRSLRLNAFHTGLLADSDDSDSNDSNEGSSDGVNSTSDEVSEVLSKEKEILPPLQIKKSKVRNRQQKDMAPVFDADWEEALKDMVRSDNADMTSSSLQPITVSVLLQQHFSASHLDVDQVLRQVLGQARPRTTNNKNVTSKKRFLFGEPKEHWTTSKPSTYMGGGIGMIASNSDDDDDGVVRFSFQYSDTYNTRQRMQYETQIQPSADANILAMFVAENSYCVEALYQLAMLFYHTGEMEKGNELLRRALYVHESTFTAAFRDSFFFPKKQQQHQRCIMDATQPENSPFFLELFTLMQVASMMGCFDTALAISQLLFALDPQHDYMGMLCCFLDFFSLATSREEFIVNLVESKLIQIRPNLTPRTTSINLQEELQPCCCGLLDMPNWAFSYALAQKRLERKTTSSCNENIPTLIPYQSADHHLQYALRRFPSVLSLLIENNKDCLCCANHMNWSAIASHFNMLSDATCQNNKSVDHIIRIFIKRSRGLWYNTDVWTWLYECGLSIMQNGSECTSSTTCNIDDDAQPMSFAALERYMTCDPADYEDTFKRLPMDANPLDEALVLPALAVDNPRRNNLRLLRDNRNNNNRPQVDEQERDLQEMLLAQFDVQQTIINPDEPILSIFLRSLLPWARVDGTPHL